MHKKLHLSTTVLCVLIMGICCGPLQAQQVQTQLTDPPDAPAVSTPRPADAPLPGAKELLAKNDEAMGGLAAWSKSTTKKMKGVYQTEDNSMFLAIEILQKAPNKSLTKITLPNGVTVREVCDGQSAWVETSLGGYQALTGAALASRLRLAEFQDRAKLVAIAATGKVGGTEKIGTHNTYVLDFSIDKKVQSRLYFDADSGLVVRSIDTVATTEGPYAVKMDMDDYREVDGLKFPFRIKRTEKGAVINIRLTQVILNPAIDDSTFFKPEFAK